MSPAVRQRRVVAPPPDPTLDQVHTLAAAVAVVDELDAITLLAAVPHGDWAVPLHLDRPGHPIVGWRIWRRDDEGLRPHQLLAADGFDPATLLAAVAHQARRLRHRHGEHAPSAVAAGTILLALRDGKA
ncbi:MAG: hypothetical protein ACT4QF_00245 [Sporichthyaceae bacterium]